MNIKGNDYLQPAYRLVWLREERPDWTIDTSEISFTKEGVIVFCKILNEQSRLIATGRAFCGFKDFSDPIEKAETSAIGRALNHAGYGTAYGEAEETIKRSDSPLQRNSQREAPQYGANPKPLASKQNIPNRAPNTQSGTSKSSDPGDVTITFGDLKGKQIKDVPLEDLKALLEKTTSKFLKDKIGQYLMNGTPVTEPNEFDPNEEIPF